MASSTNPPSVEQVSNLVLSDTFYTWFNVSNDIVNKINPIEVYSISADARDYSTVGADGITIDDLGQGNYRIGYIMPSNITGGHTFHQDINFAAGASGPIVNALNGVTGETTAVTTISGRSITSTVAGVANVEAVVLEINGISASTAGGLTLDLTGIATTGDLGTILTATGPGPGPFGSQTQLFFGKPEPDQLGIRIKGATHSAAVVMGGPLGTTTDPDYRLSVLAGNSGASGAISVVGDEDLAPTVMLRNSGSINGEGKLTLMSGGAGGPGSIELRIGTGLTAGQKSRVLTVADDSGTPYVGISGDLRDKTGAAGSSGQMLTSQGTNGGLAWATPPSAGAFGTTAIRADADLFFYDAASDGSQILVDGDIDTYYYPSGNPIMVSLAIAEMPDSDPAWVINLYYKPASGSEIQIYEFEKTTSRGINEVVTFPMVAGTYFRLDSDTTANYLCTVYGS